MVDDLELVSSWEVVLSVERDERVARRRARPRLDWDGDERVGLES